MSIQARSQTPPPPVSNTLFVYPVLPCCLHDFSHPVFFSCFPSVTPPSPSTSTPNRQPPALTSLPTPARVHRNRSHSCRSGRTVPWILSTWLGLVCALPCPRIGISQDCRRRAGQETGARSQDEALLVWSFAEELAEAGDPVWQGFGFQHFLPLIGILDDVEQPGFSPPLELDVHVRLRPYSAV